VHFIRGLKTAGRESGQVLVLFAVSLSALLLCAGMAIDFGLAYLTKAQLARASDAASLTVMLNLGQGQTVASSLGQNMFAANLFLSRSWYASAPVATISFATDAYGDPIVNVAATATTNTYFIRLAGFTTLAVSNSSQATRPPVILAMALDRSGSMGSDGGSTALPPAVRTFLYYFIENQDQLSEESFSYTDRIDVPMTKTFHTPINNSLSAMTYIGATFGYGGLVDAEAQVLSVAPPPGAERVVVFFTDGMANTIQDILKCPPGNTKELDYGGNDTGTSYNVWLSTDTTGKNISSTCNPTTFPATDPVLGGGGSLATAKWITLDQTQITTEGEYRAINEANKMRAEGITVYAVGLGTGVNPTFLQEVANDPSSPTYDASFLPGLAEFSTSGTDTNLSVAFQQIGNAIVNRLTH